MSYSRLTVISVASAMVLGSGALAATPADAAPRHHRSFHHAVTHHRNSGIPQHDGGDRDADNNGGPSDGDGNV
jgi:hypothetical protein